jgi:hypothetical protein
VTEQNEEAHGDVMMPGLALYLLQDSMSSTQTVTNRLALTAWEQLRDLAHEAVLFFSSVDKATETATTRKIEHILGTTPVESWERTRDHASEMVRKLGGDGTGSTW